MAAMCYDVLQSKRRWLLGVVSFKIIDFISFHISVNIPPAPTRRLGILNGTLVGHRLCRNASESNALTFCVIHPRAHLHWRSAVRTAAHTDEG